MARYIDAEKLINNIDALVINSQDVMFIRKLIADLETEDVKPVVHAHKDIATSKSGMTMFFECSNCYKAIDYSDVYCKYCGAKMDEVQDG